WTPCLPHQPSGCSVPCVGGCAGACTLSHSDACSTCALTLAKSTPRKVTITSWPCRVAFSVILTGASGNGAVGASGCTCAGASAWPLVPALHFFCTNAVARFCIPAAMRCLHQPEGALGKSLHSHVLLQITYCVAPLDCEAILALPSASSSTSPCRTMA